MRRQFSVNNHLVIFDNTVEFNAKNIKILKDLDNEEIKNIEGFKQIPDFKELIEDDEFEFTFQQIMIIIGNIDITKVNASINQPFKSNFAEARMFQFDVIKSTIDGFKPNDKLIQNIPDYTSLGYDKKNTKMKIKGSPIALNLSLITITNKTISMLRSLKNKNIYKLSWLAAIHRDRSLWSDNDQTLLKIIRSMDTLRELSITVREADAARYYKFKNLTKDRRERILDAVWGLNSADGSRVELKSLQNTGDSVSRLK